MKMSDKRLGAYNRIVKGRPAGDDDTSDAPAGTASTARGGESPAASGDRPRAAAGTASDGVKSRPGSQSVPPKGAALPGLVKVSSTGGSGRDSPYRRVAKFLLLIGTDEAARVMSKLSGEQVDKVVLELASIRRVERDEASVVLAEFESLLREAREPSGGVDTARTILTSAFGAERAEQMLGKAVPDLHGKPFDYLADMDSDRLLRLLSGELPAVKALVLSQLKPKQAADAIRLMEPVDKQETVRRLAKLTSINPEVLRRVDEGMREKVQNVSTASADSIDGRSALAEILKRMDGASEKSILSGLSETDPDLGKDLRERLFTVDDIVRADDRFLQETLRPMSDRDLAVLVAGKNGAFRNKILSNLSKTRGALVLEEEQAIAPVTRAESERVTGTFFAILRRAWESGDCFVAGRDDKEVWV